MFAYKPTCSSLCRFQALPHVSFRSNSSSEPQGAQCASIILSLLPSFFSSLCLTSLSHPQEVKEKLYELEKLDPGSTEFDTLLESTMSALHKHIETEEQDEMPKLEALLMEEDSQSAAGSFARTKMIAPTR